MLTALLATSLASTGCDDSEATTADGGLPDATTTDAGTADGSATDGAEATEPFCATRTGLPFCEDFDRSPLPGTFASKEESGATLAVDGNLTTSPPNALVATTSATGTAPLVATLKTPTLGPGRKYRLFAQVQVEKRGGDASTIADVLAMTFDGGYRLAVATDGAGGWRGVEEGREDAGSAPTVFPSTAAITDEDWISIRFEVDVTEEGTGRFSLKLGDTAIVERELIDPPFSLSSATGVVGLRVSAPSEWRVLYDNVTFSVE